MGKERMETLVTAALAAAALGWAVPATANEFAAVQASATNVETTAIAAIVPPSPMRNTVRISFASAPKNEQFQPIVSDGIATLGKDVGCWLVGDGTAVCAPLAWH